MLKKMNEQTVYTFKNSEQEMLMVKQLMLHKTAWSYSKQTGSAVRFLRGSASSWSSA